ncbi:MAG: hypothetical protein Q9170_004034 [Blastenia crenularia]
MPSSNASFYTPIYSALEPSISLLIGGLNRATEQAVRQNIKDGDECSICHDSLNIEDPTKLAMVTLPKCGHRFHEICIMEWLSPIKMPPTETLNRELAEETNDRNGAGNDTSEPATHETQEITHLPRVDRMIALGIDRYDAMEQERDGLTEQLASLERRNNEFSRRYEAVEALLAQRHRAETEEERDRLTSALLDASTTLDSVSLDVSLESFDGVIVQIRSRSPIIRPYRFTARSHCCPLCRQPAFSLHTAFHADTIQLVRLRCRLTDFAYALLNYERGARAAFDRDDVTTFLFRRYLDNLAQNSREIIPSHSDCQLLFNHARYILCRDARKHLRKLNPSPRGQDKIQALITVFENFEFNKAYIPFFFDPSAKYDAKMKRCLSESEKKGLREDPKAFFAELEKSPKRFFKMLKCDKTAEEKRVTSLTREVEDRDMVDAE